jgi:hypothetical protein
MDKTDKQIILWEAGSVITQGGNFDLNSVLNCYYPFG